MSGVDLALYEGLCLIGRFESAAQVQKRDGTPVPGLFSIVLTCNGPMGARQLRASYNLTDEMGSPTRIAEQVGNGVEWVGRLVQVPVRAEPSKDGRYMNYRALSVFALDGDG